MGIETNSWVHRGFYDFARGWFDDGGSNLYVNARGVIEMIHRTDVNNDGYVDIILPNSHGYIERGPTWIYTQADGEGRDWPRRELPNDSGWMSRIVDVDGDGYPDLIVVNGENGVTSELSSYIYWGGPGGLTRERAEFATAGAYDVAAVDVNGDGKLDLIFPSAWVDHHNRGRPRLVQVFLQGRNRRFEDASQRYGLFGVGAVSIACADLTGNGRPDMVLANYRSEYEYDTDSFVYWGTEDGFDPTPLRLPTHYAQQVILADLNEDGCKEIIFAGGDEVRIYWNKAGQFRSDNVLAIAAEGFNTMFCVGVIHAAVSDVDGDGKDELVLATKQGVEIRPTRNLETVQQFLPLSYVDRVHAADLDGDGRPELIVSRYYDHVSYETDSAIFWNGPEGFSPERVTWLPTRGAVGNTVGDLDGDGRPEIVFNNTMGGPSQFWDEHPAYVYLGNRHAEYNADRRLDLPVASGGSSYVLVDLDMDGYPDLVFSHYGGVRIFPGGPKGPTAERFIDLDTPNRHILQVHVADFNRDGYLDLLAVGKDDDKPESMAAASTLFYGSADGFFTERSENLPTYCSGSAYLADVNRDAYLDIIVDDRRGYVRIFLGGPEGYSLERSRKIPMRENWHGRVATVADINNDGWLDIIFREMGHYERQPDTFVILYGSPEGYRYENSQHYQGGYSPGKMAVGDFNRDGNLDLLVPAYSTASKRVIPTVLFWGDGKSLDLENPLNLAAESGFAAMLIDLNRNGWVDVILACHRDDVGHQVDSLIYWNGPEGLSPNRVTRLPGLGPHYLSTRDFGNAYTREPLESYISPPFEMRRQTPSRIRWEAEVPETTELKFQLRWADNAEGLDHAPWHGPEGPETHYRNSGQKVSGVPPARWLQYRAIFVSLYGVRSARLREVRIDLKAHRLGHFSG